jgi:hypothetical protein
MGTLDHQDDGGGRRPRRGALVAGVAAMVLLALGALWLLRADRTTPAADEASKPATAPQGAREALPAPALPAPREGTQLAPPVASEPVQAIPSQVGTAADGWHELRGTAVRASDESPVVGATIVAVLPDGGAGGSDEVMQAQTARDGSFSFWVPPDVNFRVRLPSSGGSQADGRVAVRIEWANGDTHADDVRLVLETGWQLGVLVVDGEGRPHAGVVVKGAGRTATSAADGRCLLADLPAEAGPITLALQAPGGKPVTYTVEPPEPGLLRKDVTLKVP